MWNWKRGSEFFKRVMVEILTVNTHFNVSYDIMQKHVF